MRGGPVPRGIDPLLDVTADPNDTTPFVHTYSYQHNVQGVPENMHEVCHVIVRLRIAAFASKCAAESAVNPTKILSSL